ncbi:MAG: C25 family cysteine peptidase [bacterium]|nr:C25 family cysteine peptidase [bacterium]
MTRKVILAFLILLGFILTEASGRLDGYKKFLDISPKDYKASSFKSWTDKHPYNNEKKPKVELEDVKKANGEKKNVAIIVSDDIADSISADLALYTLDLENDGYSVFSYAVSELHPETLRSFLYELYSSLSIEGAVFVGNVTPAWFQLESDFGTDGYAEWPMDYFYMELNGEWWDSTDFTSTPVPGSDGIYDDHSGDLMPEIYIGRIMPTGFSNYVPIVKNYIAKNDEFRTDFINIDKKALIYVDDDWIPWASQWAGDVSLLYPDFKLISEGETTRVENYRMNLDTLHEWVSLFAHSWPGGHGFYYNSKTEMEYMSANDYLNLVPPTLFYNFFCCSFARYTDDNYGTGLAIFADTFSILGIGSTKTGSMLDFEYFYTPLSNGKNIGEAFKDWFSYQATGGFTIDEVSWFGGMTIIGDPFIYPTHEYLSGSFEENDVSLKKPDKNEI